MASQNELSLRKWWWVVVLAAVVGVAGAVVALQRVPSEYEGSCKLFVAGRADTGTGEGYQAAQFAQARVAAYLDLIGGARVSENAVNALGLDMSTDELQKRVTATAAPESVIMTVAVTDEQSQMAADLANAVCKAFVEVSIDAEGVNPLVNVKIVEYANAPKNPIGPSKKRYLAVGGIAGLLAGIGLVMLLGRARPPKVDPGHVAPVREAGSLNGSAEPSADTATQERQDAGGGGTRRRDRRSQQ